MIRSILERNNLHSSEIQQIILIGGSTYIPLVKKMIAEELQITVNQSVDPTNAVVVGAAHFAGGKNRKIEADAPTKNANQSNSAPSVFLKTAYQKATHDREEYFMADVSGMTIGLSYRIIRQDGGYDSGQKALPSRIAEVLPLVPNMLNSFSIKIMDANGNVVSCNVESIDIVQGKFTLHGQPLPNDICIEVDDFQNNTTKLEVVFEKNALLPLKKTLMRTVSKTINKGSKENLLINVLEGSRYSNPSACLPLGIIEFKGEDLTMNLVKGSDVEIVLEVSESRDLKIQAVLLMTDQEMTDIFNPSSRAVNLGKLETEVTELLYYARRELVGLEREELFKEAGKTQKCITELEEIRSQLRQTNDKDITDLRFQLEERKRKLAQLLDSLLKDRNAESIKNDYFEAKRFCEYSLERGTPLHKDRFERAIANERAFLASNNANLIKSKEKELYQLAWTINQNDPSFIISLFHHYQFLDDYMDERKAKHYISLGEKALERQNYQELKSIVYQLDALRPDAKREEERIKGTGLG
jgi:molecular chaperone DnaK